MLPFFDLQGGAALAAARDAAVIGLLSAFGTIIFRVIVAPKSFASMPSDVVVAVKRQLLWLAQGSTATALAGTGAWLIVQAAAMADADSFKAAFSAVPAVLAKT